MTIRKWLPIVILCLLCSAGCVPVVYAQVPATMTVEWTPNPVGDSVTNYTLQLDTNAPVSVGIVPGADGMISKSITVTAYGTHTITVIAQNISLSCPDPTVCSSGTVRNSAPTQVTFTLSPPPGKSSNPKLRMP